MIDQTLKQFVDALKPAVVNLPEKDQDFANSLVSQFEKKGTLSNKQSYWVGVLLEKATGTHEEKPQLCLTTFKGVFDFLENAQYHLKSPKVRLQTPDGDPVMLYFAGPNSKYFGSMQITDGGVFGDNKWYGAVAPDGTWTLNHQTFPEIKAVARLLQKLADDPQATATAHAKLTGKCAFCNKPIGEGKSTISAALGYGPECAIHYGLPWGEDAMVEHYIANPVEPEVPAKPRKQFAQ